MSSYLVQFNNAKGEFVEVGTSYQFIIKLKTIRGVLNRISKLSRPKDSTRVRLSVKSSNGYRWIGEYNIPEEDIKC